VQFLSLDEQRFQAEQRIMFQKDRHATARFLNMTAPVELRTSDLPSRPGDEERMRMGARARSLVETSYSYAGIGRKLAHVMEECVQASGRRSHGIPNT
jgi:hypothetical protein